MFLAFLAAAAPLADPRVLDTLEGEEFARAGIAGQILERPAGIEDDEFARAVMEAEGLRPWSGEPILVPPPEGAMGTAAIVAADGHEINVKYVVGDAARPGRICRLRLEPGVGASPARWNAYRWCAAAFGLRLPAAMSPPPIAVAIVRDFDGDELADTASVRQAGTAHELIVEHGAGGTSVIQSAVDPGIYFGVLQPGTYPTACAKGLGPSDASCPERSITFDRPTLEFGTPEASQAVAIWDGHRFRVVWLSD